MDVRASSSFRRVAPWVLAPWVLFVVGGCSSSEPTTAEPQVDAASSDAADAALDAPSEASDGSTPAVPPTPAEISFEALAPLPTGEQILFNDWNGSPNELLSMKPDGTAVTKIFRVDRIWAMGIDRAATRLAFSCTDPKQEAKYGVAIGDAIQHTWIYDVATQTIRNLTVGNLNDECHAWSASGDALWVCRRYDFAYDGDFVTFKGWRIARLDLATGAPTWVTPEVKGEYALGPQPTPDGEDLWFSITEAKPPAPQTQRVVKLALPDGAPTTVREGASRPSLSPDGARYAYSSAAEKGALHVSQLDGTADVKVTSAAGTEVRWSPDGTRLVYLVFDSAANCSHVEVVAADGSDAAAPKRIRDCKVAGDFVTELAWIDRK